MKIAQIKGQGGATFAIVVNQIAIMATEGRVLNITLKNNPVPINLAFRSQADAMKNYDELFKLYEEFGTVA